MAKSSDRSDRSDLPEPPRHKPGDRLGDLVGPHPDQELPDPEAPPEPDNTLPEDPAAPSQPTPKVDLIRPM